ncbi:MAG: hypothetical protein GY913_06930 [Proteobacteria bacterium]|nr:hypothetical protein [Pseudomonadota bacterium]MCP4916641.1 hypothetical protein [Pseudomonadota bacterium]
MSTLLRLPFGLIDRGFRMRSLTARAEPPHQQFRLSGPERAFVRVLLSRRRLWTWRCNQKHYCGDFVVVDMSEARPSHRVAQVIELKSRSPLKTGRPGIQMSRAHRVSKALVDRGVLDVGAERLLIQGTIDAILASL